MIQRNSLVTTNSIDEYTPAFKKDNVYVYLGEVPNMIGHCFLISLETGKIEIGYHTSDIRELTDEEV